MQADAHTHSLFAHMIAVGEQAHIHTSTQVTQRACTHTHTGVMEKTTNKPSTYAPMNIDKNAHTQQIHAPNYAHNFNH